MPTTYSKPLDTEWPVTAIATVLAKYHQPLAEAGVQVGVLWAANETAPPVKAAGFPVLGDIKVVPLRDRITKGIDAEVVLDERECNALSAGRKAALMDTLLTRLELGTAEDDDGKLAVRRDDLGRPRLRIRKGDIGMASGFREVIARHGEDAIEFENIRRASAHAHAALNGEVG